MAKTDAAVQTMDEIVTIAGPNLIPFRQGEVIEVNVGQTSKSKIMVDIGGIALGFIPEREFSYEVSDIHTGDKVLAYVLSVENDEGYVVLSLKRAEKEQ